MKARLPKGVGGGPGNMQSMIKQAQKMQEQMTQLQTELDEREYTAAAGRRGRILYRQAASGRSSAWTSSRRWWIPRMWRCCPT